MWDNYQTNNFFGYDGVERAGSLDTVLMIGK
jgi:hypothetical protein